MPLQPNNSPTNKKMKTIQILTTILVSLIPLHAHESHEKAPAGPNGGRLITSSEPHAEFLVTPDRKIQITFVGDDGNTVPPADQIITVITGERTAPVKVTFTKTPTGFLSAEALPEGNNLPVILQIKSSPEDKPTVAKFTLNLPLCPGCQLPEYTCTCSH